MEWNWLETRIFERTLGDDERRLLATAIRRVEFAEGARILIQNEPGGTLYLLRSGRVAVELEFSGEALHLAELGEGAQFGDMSFLDDEGASATLIARTPCVTYRMTRDDLSQIFRHHHAVACDLLVHTIKGMSRTLRQMNRVNAATIQYIHGRRSW